MRAKKLLSSRQIFRYAVPARTDTKKHCNTLSVYALFHICYRHYCCVSETVSMVVFSSVYSTGLSISSCPLSTSSLLHMSVLPSGCLTSEIFLFRDNFCQPLSPFKTVSKRPSCFRIRPVLHFLCGVH